MTIDDYINTNPTRENVLETLCHLANYYVLSIGELWCYKQLAKEFNITLDEFYDDQDELTEYERTYVGLYNWKVK